MDQLNELTNATQIDKLKEDLSADELKQAENYAVSLRDNKQNTILNYGQELQGEMSSFTDKVLENVRSKDTGEVGDSLRSLVTSLNSADPEQLGGNKSKFLRFFGKIKQSIFEMTARYQEISTQIDKVVVNLQGHEQKLLQDNDTLDTMYQANLDYYRQLNTLIVGGKMRQAEMDEQIAQLKDKLATDQSNQMLAQELSDLQNQKNRLGSRLNDLMMTREITIQQAPQIRLIQNTNAVLSEKIQSSINTAIPLWKNQVAISLSLLRQQDAVSAQNAVADTTNELLRKNSELLHQSTVDVVKATQRGVVDVDTLKETQANLIATIQEVLTIQSEGEQKRQNVESELANLEGEFKQAMLTAANQSKSSPKNVTPN
ncbi:MAG: toxic anion resistance protein [Ligilactobacillus agilis]|nr:toxic anion resistance protein [Ligilactobacillus agilis]